MSSQTGPIKPKSLKVYYHDDFAIVTTGLKIASCMISESRNIVDEQSVLKRLSFLTLNGATDGNSCSCCGIGPFESRQQQIAHYKHHWHTHNLKRKLFGKTTLTLGQFNSRVDDGDDSSVSGSDSEGESNPNKPVTELFANATRHCKAFFTNKAGQVVCVYRCILHHKKEELSTDGDGSAWVERMTRLSRPGSQRWAVLMMSGGHFAGAIFSGGTPVVHKTFHSYTTRRGQGQAQGTRDQHGNAPRSAGSNLRRYNQAKFLEHVQEIITSWTDDLNGCSLILYRAVGPINQGIIFGKSSPLRKEDMRVRQLPFPTRKPSYKEVQRIHETVASLEIYESMELFQKALLASQGKPATKSGSDTSLEKAKKQKSPNKLDRAKSRERAPRPLPTTQMSSEDEGPCYIDSETPKDWIKTLSEQASNGNITNSRKDLLLINESSSEDESESVEMKEVRRKKKNDDKAAKKEESRPAKKEESKPPKKEESKPAKKEESKNVKDEIKKVPLKISASIKKIWHAIAKEQNTLETILETWEGDVSEACNTADPADGNTALHKAAIAESPDMVTTILKAGGDPCVRNHLLQTPYAATPHSDTRIAFRLFQGLFPARYNYGKSQIPGPLTPEMLDQEKERKAQQKRAKRQREKESKSKNCASIGCRSTLGEAKLIFMKQLEKAKSNKFLQLDDKEKTKSEEKRCFACASALPKAPFEYNNYQFCTIKCLQNHRNIRPLNMSV